MAAADLLCPPRPDATQVLGSWSLSKAKKLSWNEGDLWMTEVDLPSGADIQYKYAITSHNHEDAQVRMAAFRS